MCGIAGILLSPSATDVRPLDSIGAITASLAHRGPDAQGVWSDRDAGIAFGHRRLAIVDLSESGSQPMRSANGRYVITFNGEIYNFRDLRRELESAGCRFTGGSDTEVMLCAIERWGLRDALARFAGMFAFGLWDTHTRTLHLARDRIGKKPLYVARAGKALVFASELKAINAFPGFHRTLDRSAALSMLSRGWVPDDQCIWQDAFKLPPGGLLSLPAAALSDQPSISSLRDRVGIWWSMTDVASNGRRNLLSDSDDGLVTSLDKLLNVAVSERMVADVPLGAFLSGGIDSSTVVAIMQAHSAKPVRTFTIGFGEGGFDESSHAAEVARYLGTDHTQLRLTASAARDVIPELPRIWDEPFADESQIPTLLVSRLARQHVTVALSGDGGDECFAGYSRHFAAERLSRLQRSRLPFRGALSASLALLAQGSTQQFLQRLPLSTRMRLVLRGDRLDRLAGLLGSGDENELFDRLVGPSGRNVAALPPEFSRNHAAGLDDLVSRVLLDDATRYLPGDILVKLDRASMADSLEGRCPILDHRVVEFAWRLPTSAKVRAGKGKWILRQVLGRYMPASLFERPKQGFDVPVGAWLRGPLASWATDLLSDLRRSDENIVDMQTVDEIWRDHVTGKRDHSRELWSVLMFQAWYNEARPAPRPSIQPLEADLVGG